MSILKKLSVATAGALFIALRTVETVQAVTVATLQAHRGLIILNRMIG